MNIYIYLFKVFCFLGIKNSFLRDKYKTFFIKSFNKYSITGYENKEKAKRSVLARFKYLKEYRELNKDFPDIFPLENKYIIDYITLNKRQINFLRDYKKYAHISIPEPKQRI